ncbi:MAG: NAD(+) synthase, partial [Deferribacteraceae bacterium]|nr:NAD(+) synthase [Deferribacteraceae bacterium]
MITINKQTLGNLIAALRSSIQATGAQKVVLGLSGGIDSALSAALAAEALGAQNVLVYNLPYEASSAASRTDAQLMASHLGLTLETIELTAMAKAYPHFTSVTPHRLGNILARLRMVVLFDKSAEHGALVLGSSNKSEILLGYSTWYGDSASAINPLGDLYKTQVYQAAKLLGIPKALINKAPSADLRPNQTDEADIGYTYAEMDRFFDLSIEQKLPKEELVTNFGQAMVDDLLRRVAANSF